jgi:hypothetical protein
MPPGPAGSPFPAPGQPASGQYPPGGPGYPPPQGPGYPPPQGPGYPPPGGYYRQPPRTVPQGITVNVKTLALIGIPVLIAVVALLLVLLILKPFSSPTMNVPLPNGWREVTGVTADSTEKSLQAAYNGVKLDAYYSNDETEDVIIAFHFKTKGALDAPPADATMGEMEDYIAENRDALETQLTGGLGAGAANVNAEVKVFDAEELASGDVALHVQVAASASGTTTFMSMNLLLLSKKNTGYMVMLVSSNEINGENTFDYLKQNITFK